MASHYSCLPIQSLEVQLDEVTTDIIGFPM